jgi:hypothetical protein
VIDDAATQSSKQTCGGGQEQEDGNVPKIYAW